MKKKFSYHFFSFLILFFSAISADAQEAKLLERVQNLKTPSVKKKITVYHTAGYEKRVREIQPLLENMMFFYKRRLGYEIDLSVAVLDKAQWEQVTGIPYGLPFVSDTPHIALLPATADGVIAADMLKLKNYFTPAMMQKLKKSGFSFEQAAAKTVDLIGLHELGHIYARKIGIVPPLPNKWFNEFLASYFAYLYLRKKQPKLATVFYTMTADAAGVTPPQKYTKLEDFERLYVEVGAENYAWFEGKFFERVAPVYKATGTTFFAKVQWALPPNQKEPLPVEIVLERLEKIAPGFIDWSKNLR